jgi:hypothetical protein
LLFSVLQTHCPSLLFAAIEMSVALEYSLVTELVFIEGVLLIVKVNVKLSLCLTKHHTMKTYWGVEI